MVKTAPGVKTQRETEERNQGMTDDRETSDGRCPLCGERLLPAQKTTIHFVVDDRAVVAEDVPAEVCSSCHEPYVVGEVADRITALLKEPEKWPSVLHEFRAASPDLTPEEADTDAARETACPRKKEQRP